MEGSPNMRATATGVGPPTPLPPDSPTAATRNTTLESSPASPPALSPSDTDVVSVISSTLSSSLGYGKSWAHLPTEIINHILDIVYEQYQRHQPDVSFDAAPWNIAEHHGGWERTRSFWNHVRFIKRLRELEGISVTWEVACHDHWAWTLLADPKARLVKAHSNGKTGIKCDRMTAREEATLTCWLCGLFAEVYEDAEICCADKWLTFQDLGLIPVCKEHAEACSKCARTDLDAKANEDLQLELTDDREFFPSWSRTCRACRDEAFFSLCDKVGWTGDLLPTFVHQMPKYAVYAQEGTGTARDALQQAGAHAWIRAHVDLERRIDENCIDAKVPGRIRQFPDADNRYFKDYEKAYNASLSGAVIRLAKRHALQGIWLAADELQPELWKSVPHIVARLPMLYSADARNAQRDNYAPTKQFTSRHVAIADPTTRALYNDQLRAQIYTAISEPLLNLAKMLCVVTGDNFDIARIRAEMMTPEDLLAWLHDPRLWQVDWFRKYGRVMPRLPDRVSLRSVARNTQAATEDTSSGTKRKRPSADEGEAERTSMSKQGSPKAAKVAEPIDELTPRSSTLASGESTPPDMGTPMIDQTSAAGSPVPPDESRSASDDPLGIRSLPWPQPDPHFGGILNDPLIPPQSLVYIPTSLGMIRQFAFRILAQCWQDVTAELRRCPCSICKRALEQERREAEAAVERARLAKLAKEAERIQFAYQPVRMVTPQFTDDDEEDYNDLDDKKYDDYDRRGGFFRDEKAIDDLVADVCPTPLNEVAESDADDDLALLVGRGRRRQSGAPEPSESPEREEPAMVSMEADDDDDDDDGATETEPEFEQIVVRAQPPVRQAMLGPVIVPWSARTHDPQAIVMPDARWGALDEPEQLAMMLALADRVGKSDAEDAQEEVSSDGSTHA